MPTASLWQTCLFSLAVAVAATVLAAAVAIPLAYLLAHRSFPGKTLVETLITVPLVLPPTVVGFAVIVLMGRRGLVGRFLARWFHGYTILFRPEGAVLAALLVGLPLLYLPCRAAFLSIDRDLQDVARLTGIGRWGAFWQIALPLSRRPVAAGLLMAFARGLGEFGATIMVLGDLPGRQTLPIAIFDAANGEDYAHALPAVLALCAVSLGVVGLYNRLPLTRQD